MIPAHPVEMEPATHLLSVLLKGMLEFLSYLHLSNYAGEPQVGRVHHPLVSAVFFKSPVEPELFQKTTPILLPRP